MKYLCLDPGLKHTGVAISYEGKIAVPYTTIEASSLSSLVTAAINVINQELPDTLIIGQPSAGELHLFSQQLQSQLSQHYSYPVILHGEDLSSKIAVKHMVEGGTPKNKRQTDKHQTAAAIILQDYLDTYS